LVAADRGDPDALPPYATPVWPWPLQLRQAYPSPTLNSEEPLKVPHALTLHAIQLLPVLALLLLVSDIPERQRIRIVGLATVGYGLLIAATVIQTYAGHRPLDLEPVPAVLALGGLVMFGGTALVALRGLGSRLNPPGPTRVGA
jgi:hypothetical protein